MTARNPEPIRRKEPTHDCHGCGKRTTYATGREFYCSRCWHEIERDAMEYGTAHDASGGVLLTRADVLGDSGVERLRRELC